MRTHSLGYCYPAIERAIYPLQPAGYLARSAEARKNISWVQGGFFSGNQSYLKTAQLSSGIPMRSQAALFSDQKFRSISLLNPTAAPLTLKEAQLIVENHLMKPIAAVIKGQDNSIAYTAKLSNHLYTIPCLQQALKKELTLYSRELLTKEVRFQNSQFLYQNLQSIVNQLSNKSASFLRQQREFIAKPLGLESRAASPNQMQDKKAPPHGFKRDPQGSLNSGLTAESLVQKSKTSEPLVKLAKGVQQKKNSFESPRDDHQWSKKLRPNSLQRESQGSLNSCSTAESLARIPKKSDPIAELKKISRQKQKNFASLSLYQQLVLLDYSDPLQGIHKIKNKLRGNEYLLNKISHDFRPFHNVKNYKDIHYDIDYSTFIRKLPDGTQECHLKFHGMSSMNHLGSVIRNAMNLLDPARIFKNRPDGMYQRAADIVGKYAKMSQEQRMKFTLSGHSLGGGLAEHAMAMHHDLIDLAVINQPYHALGINSDALTANQAAQNKIFYPRILEDQITPTFMWHEYPQAHLIPITTPPLLPGQERRVATAHNSFSDYMVQNIVATLS